MSIKTSNLGYPRIGEQREWKRTLESFWKGSITEDELHTQMKEIRLNHLKKQMELGIDYIPVNDFTYYDHVLDTATMFGIVPNRFQYSGGAVSLATYYAMARGGDAQACEMTKWFDTNYHYIVPELQDAKPTLVENKPLKAFKEAKEELNVIGKPVILGPFTFLSLSKGYKKSEFSNLLSQLIPLYSQVLSELKEAGAEIVQIDEPTFVTDLSEEDWYLIKQVYTQLANTTDIDLIVQTYFESVDQYLELISLPVKGIGLDFVYGKENNLNSLITYGFPQDKVLGVGIIDGRNIWKSDLNKVSKLLERINEVVPYSRQLIQPSSSLLHVPVTLKYEDALDPLVKGALAYCDEKLEEMILLKDILSKRYQYEDKLKEHQKGIYDLGESAWRTEKKLNELKTNRGTHFSKRAELQHKKWKLPLLPTTTIGSFPQTTEVRQTRLKWRKGELSNENYEQQINEYMKKWIQIQEDLELDVFVHGEFERNDMVEFFGEKLSGFAFSKNGWVQSYGSRCVKPPIIFGNVEFTKPMTVKEVVYAQSLTEKPVKGMLTGPVTILNWSFARNDISNKEISFQIAEALLKEVQALEEANITMIQVDEPALREGLPLKKEKQEDYLQWSIEAFRRCTSDIDDLTQIHTHMCYSEFNEIIDAIDAMDADVISIETSRSHGEMIEAFEKTTYTKGIGLGVYDIHSPRIPNVSEMSSIIERALKVLPAESFWVNPDCGLKTRSEEETIAALKKMVDAAKKARENITVSSQS
ncbi:5-methyltetrahydropteroyltriglutamate--homocysteine S-methyltransferase [Halalkalibacter sp. AB-rgal2]|uniref:5-methyltetrahydropteroyltriglutamate-- homocysteine S-methyltransferase n=1 Tax=Halalkalibacter sp. AB-rgal2 TaxID=3242695 RepID=UPI00359E9064